MDERDKRTFPTWVISWRDPTKNFGCAGGYLRHPHYERDREIRDLEVHMMLSELEYHANWGT